MSYFTSNNSSSLNFHLIMTCMILSETIVSQVIEELEAIHPHLTNRGGTQINYFGMTLGYLIPVRKETTMAICIHDALNRRKSNKMCKLLDCCHILLQIIWDEMRWDGIQSDSSSVQSEHSSDFDWLTAPYRSDNPTYTYSWSRWRLLKTCQSTWGRT